MAPTRVSYDASPRGTVTIDLAAGTATTDYSGTDTLTDIENAIGGSLDDVITGDGDANRLEGRDGVDRLIGAAARTRWSAV